MQISSAGLLASRSDVNWNFSALTSNHHACIPVNLFCTQGLPKASFTASFA